MKWPKFEFGKKPEKIQDNESELVPGFKADPETDAYHLPDFAQLREGPDDQIAEWLADFKTSDGRTLEEYLAPYINAESDGSGKKWRDEVGFTESVELLRLDAARIIANYLVRTRNAERGTLN
jgi:hypothetical protein